MPATRRSTLMRLGASGCRREKASSRWVSAAAALRALAARFHRAARPAGLAGKQRAPRGVDVARDDGQKIVEVVRDAAGQLADRLHLLRLPKRLFGLLASGHRLATRSRAPG